MNELPRFQIQRSESDGVTSVTVFGRRPEDLRGFIVHKEHVPERDPDGSARLCYAAATVNLQGLGYSTVADIESFLPALECALQVARDLDAEFPVGSQYSPRVERP